MALRLPISSSHGLATSPAPISTTCRPAVSASGSLFPARALAVGGSASAAASQKRSLLQATVVTASETRGVAPVRSSGIETTAVGVEAVTGLVTEVTKDTFWPIVKAAGDKVVVLDMYTEWCGPCKVMAPKFQEMSEKNLDVVFLKLDCNQDNKSLRFSVSSTMNPSAEISPSTQLLLSEIRKLFDEHEAKWDRRFAAMDAAWDQRLVSRGGSVPTSVSTLATTIGVDVFVTLTAPPHLSGQDTTRGPSSAVAILTQAAAIQGEVIADNWGGLFDGDCIAYAEHKRCVAIGPSALVDTPTLHPVQVLATERIHSDFVVHADQERRAAIAHTSRKCVPKLPGLDTVPAPSATHADLLTNTFPKPDHFFVKVATTKLLPTKCSTFGLDNNIVDSSVNVSVAPTVPPHAPDDTHVFKPGPDVPLRMGLIDALDQTPNSKGMLTHYGGDFGDAMLFVGGFSYTDPTWLDPPEPPDPTPPPQRAAPPSINDEPAVTMPRSSNYEEDDGSKAPNLAMVVQIAKGLAQATNGLTEDEHVKVLHMFVLSSSTSPRSGEFGNGTVQDIYVACSITADEVPTKCSLYCHNGIASMLATTMSNSSPSWMFSKVEGSFEHRISTSTAVSTLERLDPMTKRYIMNFNHAYSIGSLLSCSASEKHDVQKGFEGMLVQNLVQLVMFSNSTQCQLLPWPSFGCFAKVELKPWPNWHGHPISQGVPLFCSLPVKIWRCHSVLSAMSSCLFMCTSSARKDLFLLKCTCLMVTEVVVIWKIFGVSTKLYISNTNSVIVTIAFCFSLPDVHSFHIKLMACMILIIFYWVADMVFMVCNCYVSLLLPQFNADMPASEIIKKSMTTCPVQLTCGWIAQFDFNSLFSGISISFWRLRAASSMVIILSIFLYVTTPCMSMESNTNGTVISACVSALGQILGHAQLHHIWLVHNQNQLISPCALVPVNLVVGFGQQINEALLGDCEKVIIQGPAISLWLSVPMIQPWPPPVLLQFTNAGVVLWLMQWPSSCCSGATKQSKLIFTGQRLWFLQLQFYHLLVEDP